MFEFNREKNVVFGSNGVGKTNLLEAVHYVSTARSFRDAEDGDLVKWGRNYFRIEADLVENRINYRVRIIFKKEAVNGNRRKEILINGKPLKRITDLFRVWPTVVLSSSDHRLIDGSPQLRRRYLDRVISVVDPIYSANLHRYRKVVENKNALLKENPQREELFHWNRKMEEIGSQIIGTRSNWVKEIGKRMGEIFRSVSFKELTIEYTPSIDFKIQNLDDFIEDEIKEGHSLYGPHRDSIEFQLNGRRAKVFASEGEKRVIVFSWILAVKDLYEKITGKEPALVLDDPLSVIGEDRARLFLELCGGQYFISTVRNVPDLRPSIILDTRSSTE